MKDLCLLPDDLLKRLKLIVPKVYQEVVFCSFFAQRPTTFRVNYLKTTTDDLEKTLKESGFNSQRSRSIPGAFLLVGQSNLRQLMELPAYKGGYFYLQSFSSMLPVFFLGPRPGEDVLDLTAAPGSKTTQMAALMGNQGAITALESNQVRFYKLLANLKTQGVQNTKAFRGDARFFWRDHREQFDKVLLDAPCSGEGRLHVQEPETFSHWSLKEVKRNHFLQKSLIFSAVNCLRSGGILVYSTCTLSPEENEVIIDFALEKFKGQLVVEEPPIHLPNFSPPLKSFAGVEFSEQISRSVRIFPDEKFEGFFICRLRKI